MVHILRRLGAPRQFAGLFRALPHNFVERFMRFVFLDRVKKDAALAKAAAKVNKGVFVAILYEIERLARDYLKVDTRDGRTGEGKYQLLSVLYGSASVAWRMARCRSRKSLPRTCSG